MQRDAERQIHRDAARERERDRYSAFRNSSADLDRCSELEKGGRGVEARAWMYEQHSGGDRRT